MNWYASTTHEKSTKLAKSVICRQVSKPVSDGLLKQLHIFSPFFGQGTKIQCKDSSPLMERKVNTIDTHHPFAIAKWPLSQEQ